MIASNETPTCLDLYADWEGCQQLIGQLKTADDSASDQLIFTYHPGWIKKKMARAFDAMLIGAGEVPREGLLPAFISDLLPRGWGQRVYRADAERIRPLEYLVAISDTLRSGALRLALPNTQRYLAEDHSNGCELDALPQIQATFAHLEQSREIGGLDKTCLDAAIPTSGKRPKAYVTDKHGHMWLAKFPSIHDQEDVGAWSYLAYRLALNAGLKMPSCKLVQQGDAHHILLSKRFDRHGPERRHVSTAQNLVKVQCGPEPGYLDLAQFIQRFGSQCRDDLSQLWRRLYFNIVVSNHSDHFDNHSLLFHRNGWTLAPAHSILPDPDASRNGLSIDGLNPVATVDDALHAADYFRIKPEEIKKIQEDVLKSVERWQKVARMLKIPEEKQRKFASAFKL